jgi:hypothetical protein
VSTAAQCPTPSGYPRGTVWLAGVALLGACVFYAFLRLGTEHDAIWGVMGDAVAPFTALFNAGALFTALWAVHLQRQESHEAGESTRQQLEKMAEQVAQFARAADAQRALAQSQSELAEAQKEANRIALDQHRQFERTAAAQEELAMAEKQLAVAQLKGAEASCRAGMNAAMVLSLEYRTRRGDAEGAASVRDAIDSKGRRLDGLASELRAIAAAFGDDRA